MLTVLWNEGYVDELLFQLDPIWIAIAKGWAIETVGAVNIFGSGPLPSAARPT
jgi:hypothetical protein